MSNEFFGFTKPTFTQVPDEIIDHLMADLSGSELKVLLYIVRRTFGFRKDADAISLNQIINGITTKDGRVLDRGTGLSVSTVVAALKSLETKRIIAGRRSTSPERGHEPTVYELHFIDPYFENRSSLPPKIEVALLRKSKTQQTAEQQTEDNKQISNVSKRHMTIQEFEKAEEKQEEIERWTHPERFKSKKNG